MDCKSHTKFDFGPLLVAFNGEHEVRVKLIQVQEERMERAYLIQLMIGDHLNMKKNTSKAKES